MKILIVKIGALGDVLRTTSLLRPLHSVYPGSTIDWVTGVEAKPLLNNNPLVQRVLTLKMMSRNHPSRRFDLVLSLEEDHKAALIAERACRGRLIGVCVRGGSLGYTQTSAAYYDLSVLNCDTDGQFEKANRLKKKNRRSFLGLMFKMLEISAPKNRQAIKPILNFVARDRQSAVALARRYHLEGNAPIGFNPGSGIRWPSKRIPVSKSIEILHVLHKKYKRPLILLGGSEESKRNKEICKQVQAPLINPGTHHNLRQFAAIVDLCELLVTTDSLAFHIATALNKKVIALVGPTAAQELDTFRKGQEIISMDDCKCFYKTKCRFRESCLQRFPLEKLLGAVSRCL